MTCPTYGSTEFTYGDDVINYDGSLSDCAMVDMYFRVTEVWQHLGLDPLVQPGVFTVDAVAEEVWLRAIEGVETAEQMMRIIRAAIAGKRSGLGTATEQYHSKDGTKVRISFPPTDNYGNGTPTTDGTP